MLGDGLDPLGQSLVDEQVLSSDLLLGVIHPVHHLLVHLSNGLTIDSSRPENQFFGFAFEPLELVPVREVV